MKKTFLRPLILSFFIFLMSAIPASAAISFDPNLFGTGEVIQDDVYIAAEEVFVSEMIAGDLIAVGGRVFLDGKVESDVLSVGGQVFVASDVGDDLRVVGGEVIIDKTIGGDLVIVGGEVFLSEDSVVSGDVLIFAGDVVIGGIVNGDVSIYAGEVTLFGAVTGNVEITSADRIMIGADTEIKGDLTYSSSNVIVIDNNAVIEGTITQRAGVFVPSAVGAYLFLAMVAAFFFLAKIIYTIVAIVIATTVFPKFSRVVADRAIQQFMPHTFKGLLVFLGVPLIIFLLLVSVLGVFLSIFTTIAYTLFVIITNVFMAIVAGALLSLWIKKKSIVNWQWALLGAIGLSATMIIPPLGVIVHILLFLATMGVLASLAYSRLKK